MMPPCFPQLSAGSVDCGTGTGSETGTEIETGTGTSWKKSAQ